MMAWTQFWDMHSGGGQKLEWSQIFIEAPEAEAISVFYSRFERNPNRVSCTCCGEDYAIHERETLEQATEYERGDGPTNRGREVTTLADYINDGGAHFIYAADIKPEERTVYVPAEGYVWA